MISSYKILLCASLVNMLYDKHVTTLLLKHFHNKHSMPCIKKTIFFPSNRVSIVVSPFFLTRGLHSPFLKINFIIEIWISISVYKKRLRYFLLVSNSLFWFPFSIWVLLHNILIIGIFLFLSSFSLWSNSLTSFTSKVKSFLISIGIYGSTQEGSISVLHSNGTWKTSWILAKYRGDTTKRLMSSPKCRSVEVINNPARPGSNHREVNCINYR
jgi:hypothetical protein